MLLGEPNRTQYDLNLTLLGIHVRVTPIFWLAALLLGLSITKYYSTIPGAPSQAQLLLLWIPSVFISILVHEFGHALAMRYYGISSHVVLYHFGGLAVPDSTVSFMGRGRASNPFSQIYISAAGPAAQLGLAAAVILIVRILGYDAPRVSLVPEVITGVTGSIIPNITLYSLVIFLLIPSVFWALLNLLPVYPLDGGQIAREIFMLSNARDGVRSSLLLSIITGIAVAVYALQNGDQFLAIMFGLLAYSSYTTLQAYTGTGGFGGRPW